MNNDESNQYDEIIRSMKGSQRAKPDPSLLVKIQEKITNAQPVIQIHQLRKYAAAAAIILIANTMALFVINKSPEQNIENNRLQTNHNQSLVNSFQIYDL